MLHERTLVQECVLITLHLLLDTVCKLFDLLGLLDDIERECVLAGFIDISL